MPMEPTPRPDEVLDLNIDALDVDQLEQRLELSAAHLEDIWAECLTCGSLSSCGSYDGVCTSLLFCTTFDGCKPQE